MGYRLEITKSKKGDEKIDNLTVKELIAGVDVMSEQLNLILEEVKKRDDLVIELENEKNDLYNTIASLTKEMQEYINENANKGETINRLNEYINKQEEIIKENNNKI